MLNEREYADKTCNLRLTAIHSLLEYAGFEENIDLMPIYIAACSVSGVSVKSKPIEYFEKNQMKALLGAPDCKNRIGKVNISCYHDIAIRSRSNLQLLLYGVKKQDGNFVRVGLASFYFLKDVRFGALPQAPGFNALVFCKREGYLRIA